MESRPPRPSRADQVWLTSAQIRALAHPLRTRLLLALRGDGPATATGLAGALRTNTGATSYHLRQLAEVGLVAEEPDRGSGRQRWWRAVHQISSWRGADFDDDPDAREAADWLSRHALSLHAEQAARWAEARHTYPSEWRDAADLSDYLLRLTPGQLRQLNEELHEVVNRYREVAPPAGTATGDGAAGAEQVLLYMHSFPVREGLALVESDGDPQ